jgi:hypothetical protein
MDQMVIAMHLHHTSTCSSSPRKQRVNQHEDTKICIEKEKNDGQADFMLNE